MGGVECLLHVMLEEEEDVAELLLGLLLRHGETKDTELRAKR